MAVIITHGKPGIGKSPRAVYEIIQRLRASHKSLRLSPSLSVPSLILAGDGMVSEGDSPNSLFVRTELKPPKAVQ